MAPYIELSRTAQKSQYPLTVTRKLSGSWMSLCVTSSLRLSFSALATYREPLQSQILQVNE